MVIKRENYINIQGWMVTELGLKGNSLLIYAIIYGFSQEDGQRFTGSRQYLADWTNSTKRCVEKTLSALVERSLLHKEETFVNGVKYCTYSAYTTVPSGEKSSPVAKKVRQGSEQSLPGEAKKVRQGSEQSSPNNLLDNPKDNLSNKNNVPDKPATRPRFVKPTLEEIEAYCLERKNKVDPQRFLDYYESNGWKVGRNSMKDWKAAVRNWERSSFTSKPGKQAPPTDYGSPEDFYR